MLQQNTNINFSVFLAGTIMLRGGGESSVLCTHFLAFSAKRGTTTASATVPPLPSPDAVNQFSQSATFRFIHLGRRCCRTFRIGTAAVTHCMCGEANAKLSAESDSLIIAKHDGDLAPARRKLVMSHFYCQTVVCCHKS